MKLPMISISPGFQVRLFPFSPIPPVCSQMQFSVKRPGLSSQMSAGCSVFSQCSVWKPLTATTLRLSCFVVEARGKPGWCAEYEVCWCL